MQKDLPQGCPSKAHGPFLAGRFRTLAHSLTGRWLRGPGDGKDHRAATHGSVQQEG